MKLSARSPIVIAIAAVATILVPFVVPGGFAVTFGLQLLIWIALASSWNLFSGAAGYPSFGHGVFFGAGIYTTTTLLTHTDLPLLVIIALAGVVPAAIAAALGAAMFASERFRADLFGLVTLALAFVVPTIVVNVPVLDGGTGVSIRDAASQTFLADDPVRLYLLAAAVALITVVLAYVISVTRWGGALTSIHDDELVAESLGVATYRYKVGTFALSAGLAGLAGAPQAVFVGYVEVGAVFTLTVPLYVIMMCILGGTGTWYGPVLGAIVIVVAREALLGAGSPEIAQIAIGLLLVVMIVLLPRGIGGLIRRRRRLKGAVS